MKIRTKLLIIIAFILLFQGLLSAQTINLNLDKVSQMVLKENISLKIAKLDLDNKEIEYANSRAENLLNKSQYNEILARYNLIEAKHTYNQRVNTLFINILKKYTDLLLMEKEIKILKKEMELNKTVLEDIDAQYKIGEKGELDLLKQQIIFANSLDKFEQVKSLYNNLKKEFKIELGIDLNKDISLKMLKKPNHLKISEEDILNTALKNSAKYKLKTISLKLTKVDKKRKEIITSAELDKKLSENRLKIADLELRKTKGNIKKESRNICYEIKKLINTIKLSKNRVNRAVKTYNVLKEQKEAGLVTNIKLIEGRIALKEAEYQLYKNYMSYYLQKLKLKQFKNPKVGVFIDD